MRCPRASPAAFLVLVIAACGGAQPVARSHVTRAAVVARVAGASAPVRSPPQALVTSETENQLLLVDLPGGRVVRRVTLPADPENVAATGDGGLVIVVSVRAGRVTVLSRDTLRAVRTFGGFDGAQIVAISPDRQHAYITSDTLGTLTAIRLSDMTITSTVRVGSSAHHLAFSPDQRRVWIALGEAANLIAIVDTTDLDHPRVIGYFSPGFPAHDLSFSPDGRQVWIGSATGPYVAAFDARDHRLLFRVPVGTPPQHVVFEGQYAYLTSGYGGAIEKVSWATRRVLERTSAPYGSFELDAADGYVTTASLLRGTLAIYNPSLRLLRVVNLAPATREVAISRP
jgi:DNA-binding beta-propeller fold protein YncE